MNKLILPMQTVEVNSTAIQKADYEYDTYKLTLTYTTTVVLTIILKFQTLYSKA